MKALQEQWKLSIHHELSALYTALGLVLDLSDVVVETPPKSDMGDIAFPMFSYAKTLRQAPPVLARRVADGLSSSVLQAEVSTLGPYVNIKLARAGVTQQVIAEVLAAGKRWGTTSALADARIMIEFSSPNTNKPLHIGHLRNNTLGESMSRIFLANGAEVCKVNLINDRGIHICKSMLAYQKFGEGRTPESAGLKPDRFVGDYYVRYAQWAASDPAAEAQALALLQAWEAGDEKVRALWTQMNQWAIEGVEQTYRRQGISFDRLYRESETYLQGKGIILEGLKNGVFRKREDGAVLVDLPWKERAEDEANAVKVMLRPDGTSIYITQDLGTAIRRHDDWTFNQLVYVVANEQDFHFRVLFYILQVLGYSWAQNLFHLSYGMVRLPDGSRIKSREGTTADADDVLDDLRDGALEEIRAKGREQEVGDAAAVAEGIALGALHYYLLQAAPTKDMIFDPQESLSFNGNTGPYLQYMGARISSMLDKANDLPQGGWTADKITSTEEWDLVKLISGFPEVVARSGTTKDPSLVAGFAYDLAKAYARFYHDHPVLTADDAEVTQGRLALSRAVLLVLKNAFDLMNIPFLRTM